MTYSVNLANIVPATSAFNVMVNSVTRPVTAIAISGTKVMLYLPTVIFYGDIITVSYTNPGINPLQSITGEQAASITSQSVTNNVASGSPPLMDGDANTYTTIGIGFQIWVGENLKTTKYNDGTSIPNITDAATWIGLTSPAYCWFNNNGDTYKNTYGALYN